jgi:hypothetical protein
MRLASGLIGVIALVLLLGSGLQGQDKDTKVKGTLPANWGKLSLSEEQKQKVYKIQGDYHDKIAALEKQVKDLKATEKSEMEKVLSDAQKALLKEIILKKAGVDDKKDDKKDK